MQYKYLYTFVFLFAALILVSCDDSDPNIQETATKDLAGEWYVTVTVDGDDIYGLGHIPIMTSNTAANVPTEILITDYINATATGGNFWSFKVKAQVDPNTKTFSANEAPSKVQVTSNHVDYETKVNILEGKVLKDAGRSKTGVVVDSIYFKIQFEDDSEPYGTTYVMSGHKRTGFVQDDY